MRVGWVGLGKLGLPCALALAEYGGHDVLGYDVNEQAARALETGVWPHAEQELTALLAGYNTTDTSQHPQFKHRTLGEVVYHADVIFVAVQTPHAPGYDGSQPTPDPPRDFEYGFLVQAVRDIVAQAARQQRTRPLTVAVVSTVLPGTCSRLLQPLIRPPLRLAYTPSFIAMGTTIPDFLDPEFRLIGADDDEAYKDVARVWAGLEHGLVEDTPVPLAPILRTSVVSAEVVKITYNTFLGAKLVFANAVMEVCHDLGADVDEVTAVLGHARRRLMSTAYLSGGMGDGGGCHPRDQLAMSWLARRLGMSFDLFGTLMQARDAQTRWLAELACEWAALTRLPVIVLGKAYKPGTSLTAGSPAALLVHHLDNCNPEVRAGWYDPHIDRGRFEGFADPAVFMVATKHPEFAEMKFYPGSVVIDPWRYLPDQDGVTVVRVGRR